MLNDELENYDYSLSLELGNCMLALDSDMDQGLCAGSVCSVVDVGSRLPGMLGSGYVLVYVLPRLSVDHNTIPIAIDGMIEFEG